MSEGWILFIVFVGIWFLVNLFMYRVVKIKWTRYDRRQGYDATVALWVTVIIMFFIIKVWASNN
jgi:hypothetical protein